MKSARSVSLSEVISKVLQKVSQEVFDGGGSVSRECFSAFDKMAPQTTPSKPTHNENIQVRIGFLTDVGLSPSVT